MRHNKDFGFQCALIVQMISFCILIVALITVTQERTETALLRTQLEACNDRLDSIIQDLRVPPS